MRDSAAALYLSLFLFAASGSAIQTEDLIGKSPRLIAIQSELQSCVKKLADEFGERNLSKYTALNKSANWIEKKFKGWNYSVSRNTFQVRNLDCHNIIAEKKGSVEPEKIVIVGAHYDSVAGTPGANDNGTGTACLLVLSHLFKDIKTERTLRFVAFTNEEPPCFQTEGEMGSWVYARLCRKNDDNIVAVISLETMGYFTDKKDSQKYPPPLDAMYPSTGNFIGFVGNVRSTELTRRCYRTFKKYSDVPIEVANFPASIPGVGWSDHWSFWQEGYAGLMITDTAPFRYPHYHKKSDTTDKIIFPKLANVVKGLEAVVLDLVSVEKKPAETGSTETGSRR